MPHHEDRIWVTRDDDQRDPFARDRDRILYSSAFRRLAGVTQVVSPTEGHIFHSRLTHSLEVAQVARRLAERLRDDFPDESDALGCIDPDVAEAAALAHDLGHPPFGHVAEQELNRLVREVGCLPDGFEGNAQSFRWVTKLCVRKDWPRFVEENENKLALKRVKNKLVIKPKGGDEDHDDFQYPKRGDFGLNLTRATLNGILKYPWLWSPDDEESRKWGVFDTEEPEFHWARELPPPDKLQSIEAAIMDWADDITYSIHDIEDFYRAGLIPLDRLACYKDEREKFLDAVFHRFESDRRPKSDEEKCHLSNAFHLVMEDEVPVLEPYSGTPAQRMSLRAFTASKIGQMIRETKLQEVPEEPLVIPQELKDQVEIMKQLVWHYVILNPALATQQHGYSIIICTLFETYLDASNRGPASWKIIPPRFRQVLEDWREDYESDMPKTRLVRNVADIVASLTDSEAVAAYRRLSGISLGSVLDLLPS